MNISTETSPIDPDDNAAQAQLFSLTVGGIIFTENGLFLVFLSWFMFKVRTKRDINDIIMHFMFVCINDTLSGLVLLALGVTKVTGKDSAVLCAHMAILSLSLNSMAQGNITCICTQRYIGARNIRKLSSGKQITRTVSLLVFNIAVCLTSYLSSILRMEVLESNFNSTFCSTLNVLAGSTHYIVIFYIVGTCFTAIADLLCLLTILRLKKEMNDVVIPIEIGTHGNSAAYTTKMNQQKAIITLSIILVFINLSYIPSTLAYTLTILGFRVAPSDLRIVFVSGFLNSLVNPVIICTRTQDIKMAIKQIAKLRA